MIIRTRTRAGRVGGARDRKSRAGPRRPQNGHVSWSVSDIGRSPIAIGASQRQHAKVPTPSSVERIVGRFCSYTKAARGVSPGPPGARPIPRKRVTGMSLDRGSDRRPSAVAPREEQASEPDRPRTPPFAITRDSLSGACLQRIRGVRNPSVTPPPARVRAAGALPQKAVLRISARPGRCPLPSSPRCERPSRGPAACRSGRLSQ
jgi:hypothetical protein